MCLVIFENYLIPGVKDKQNTMETQIKETKGSWRQTEKDYEQAESELDLQPGLSQAGGGEADEGHSKAGNKCRSTQHVL